MAFPSVTRLATSRTVLREVVADDLPALLKVNGDDAVTRFLPYATWRSPDDGAAWLARMQALMATGGAQQLVVARAEDDRAIGTALLFKHEAASARLEIGYVIGRAHWRQGLAREAIGALCGHLLRERGVRRLEAEVNPANQASTTLLERLGFTREGRLRQRWVAKGVAYDVDVYGLLADESRL